MRIDIPSEARDIIDTLYASGYEAFVVGGCVRDSLLGKKPKDWDITTSASPIEVKRLFPKTIDTGIKHGTVTVLFGRNGYEVTTYRIDGEYKDSRHPEEVIFTNDLTEDLRRRDFTINAMAYNDRTGIVDRFNGIEDLKNRIIRCVGNPTERFTEDALRMLRAVRFSAQLSFEIDADTRNAIKKLAHTLINISAERIKVEFDKILLSRNPGKIYDAYLLGITKVVLPEFDDMVGITQESKHHIYNVDKHTLVALSYMSDIIWQNNDIHLSDKDKLMLMWTILLHDIGKPSCKYFDDNGTAHFKKHDIVGVDMARKIFSRLKFDNYTSNYALKLIKWHDYRFTNHSVNMRRAMNKIGVDIFEYLFLVKEADTVAQHPDTIDEKLSDLRVSKQIYNDIRKREQCVSLHDLAITGGDLIKLGIKQGKDIGNILNGLLQMVIQDPDLNNKETLIQKVKEFK